MCFAASYALVNWWRWTTNHCILQVHRLFLIWMLLYGLGGLRHTLNIFCPSPLGRGEGEAGGISSTTGARWRWRSRWHYIKRPRSDVHETGVCFNPWYCSVAPQSPHSDTQFFLTPQFWRIFGWTVSLLRFWCDLGHELTINQSL